MGFSFIIKQAPIPEPVEGYRTPGDLAPLTTPFQQVKSFLIDGDRYSNDGESSYWGKNEVFGIDLGSPQPIWGLDVWVYHLGPAGADWFGTASQYGRVGVYKSNDDSTYTLVGEYDQPPIFNNEAANSAAWRIDFGGQDTARYWKMRANTTGTGLAIGAGLLQNICEIELYQP